MKTHILIVEGYRFMSSWFKDNETISYKILPICNQIIDNIGERKEIKSRSPFSRSRLKKWINDVQNSDDNLLIFSASMGSVEVYDYFETYGIPNFNKIAWCCIDGHSKLLKNIFQTKYGKDRPFFNRWEHLKHRFKIWNSFQTDHYPEGARFIFAHKEQCLNGLGYNHFTIKNCPKVLEYAKQCAEWVNE
jgi:hypothetical protein